MYASLDWLSTRAEHPGWPRMILLLGPCMFLAPLGRWFRTLLTPWNYFDTPDAGSATRSAPPEE